MFFQFDGNRGRSRAIFFLIVFFVIFFVLPIFRDKTLNFSEIIMDPSIKSESNVSYITLFPTKRIFLYIYIHIYLYYLSKLITNTIFTVIANPYYSKRVFSLAQSSNKLFIIEGNVSKSPTKATLDERFQVKRLYITADTRYNAGLIEGYITSNHIQAFLFYIRKLKKVLCNIVNVNETIINDTIDHYVKQKDNYDKEIMDHLNGIIEGYNMKESLSKLTMNDLFLINMLWEIDSYILNGTTNSKFDNLNEFVKFLILKGEGSANFLHSHNEFITNQIILSYFQYTPIPNNYRYYKWYRINPTMKNINIYEYEYNFVGYPGQIISTESISSLSKISTILTTQRISHFNQYITNVSKPDFIQLAEIKGKVTSSSDLKNGLSKLNCNSGMKFMIIEKSGCSYLNGKCNIDIIENLKEDVERYIYRFSIHLIVFILYYLFSKTIPMQSFYLSTPKPSFDIIYKKSQYNLFKNIINESLYNENFLKRSFRTTLSVSDSIYLLKKSFISNIRHIISMIYEEHGLIINEIEDRIEIK